MSGKHYYHPVFDGRSSHANTVVLCTRGISCNGLIYWIKIRVAFLWLRLDTSSLQYRIKTMVPKHTTVVQ